MKHQGISGRSRKNMAALKAEQASRVRQTKISIRVTKEGEAGSCSDCRQRARSEPAGTRRAREGAQHV